MCVQQKEEVMKRKSPDQVFADMVGILFPDADNFQIMKVVNKTNKKRKEILDKYKKLNEHEKINLRRMKVRNLKRIYPKEAMWRVLRQDYLNGVISEKLFIDEAPDYDIDNFEIVKAVEEKKK